MVLFSNYSLVHWRCMRLVGHTHTHCGLAHVFHPKLSNVQVELGMSHDRSPSYGDWLHAQRQVLWSATWPCLLSIECLCLGESLS